LLVSCENKHHNNKRGFTTRGKRHFGGTGGVREGGYGGNEGLIWKKDKVGERGGGGTYDASERQKNSKKKEGMIDGLEEGIESSVWAGEGRGAKAGKRRTKKGGEHLIPKKERQELRGSP